MSTLVLLPPFPFDRRIWEETIAPLTTNGRRVAVLEARGFGDAAPSGPYQIAQLADDAVRALDRLGVPMATVIGMSMGGYTALAMAARHPSRVAGLVLADTRAAADSDETRRGRDGAIAQIRGGGLAAFLDAQPPRLLSKAAPPELRARVRRLAEQPADAVIHALAALRDRPDRTAELANIQTPTLVIVGSDDAITPPAEARALAAAIPGAKLAELPGAGHLSHLEQPAAFCRTLTEFLDENDL